LVFLWLSGRFFFVVFRLLIHVFSPFFLDQRSLFRLWWLFWLILDVIFVYSFSTSLYALTPQFVLFFSLLGFMHNSSYPSDTPPLFPPTPPQQQNLKQPSLTPTPLSHRSSVNVFPPFHQVHPLLSSVPPPPLPPLISSPPPTPLRPFPPPFFHFSGRATSFPPTGPPSCLSFSATPITFTPPQPFLTPLRFTPAEKGPTPVFLSSFHFNQDLSPFPTPSCSNVRNLRSNVVTILL